MKRAITIAAMLAAAGLAGAQMFAQLFGTTEPQYVTSGLLMRLDGIQNTRAGHSSVTTTWEDLSGNGNDVAINGGTPAAACFQFNGIGTGGTLNWKPALTNGLTMEIVVMTTNAPAGLVGWPYYGLLENRNTIWYPSKNTVEGIYSIVGGSVGSKSITQSLATKTYLAITDYKMWANSTLTTNALSFNRKAPRNSFRIGAYGSTTNTDKEDHHLFGCVYAVRIYGRVLTSEEIAQNYEADKARFGL